MKILGCKTHPQVQNNLRVDREVLTVKMVCFQRVRCLLEIVPKAQVSCVSCTGGTKNIWKMFEICMSQITGNAQSSPRFGFFEERAAQTAS